MPFQLPVNEDHVAHIEAERAAKIAPFLEGSALHRPPISNQARQVRDQLQDAWVKPLTNKQRKFVSALFGNGFNTLKAAKTADPSLSNAAAARKGKYWYSLPVVKHAIESAYSYFDEAQKVRWEEIISELRTIAFSNIMDFHKILPNGDPQINLPKGMDDPRLKAISEIVTEDTKFGTRTKLKLYDKLNAIEKLIKMLDPAKNEDAKGAGGISIQNINIIPVPQGQFLPAPTIEAKPLLELKSVKSIPAPVVKPDDIIDVDTN